VLLEAVRRGWQVTWLAAGFAGGVAESEHKGIRIVRRGTWWNFNLVVPRLLRREFAGSAQPELIIEDINKVPCFAPWFTRAPVAVVIPHLFGTTVFREANPLVALYVLALESLIPRVYAKCRFLVISESTRDDIVARGIPTAQVHVVHCGVDHARYHPDRATAKANRPTLTFVGRLRRYKGLDWVLKALPGVLARVPEAKLEIIGDGPYEQELRRNVAKLQLERAVEFLGFLPGEKKVERLRASWAVLQPSPKEGWGLTVVEASACGTAVVASDAPGLRDSVRRDETGLLVTYADAPALTDAIVRVLTDMPLRQKLEQGGLAWAARFRWDDCGRRSMTALTGEGSDPTGGAAA
jgi:glycosyltransferase involved in cell wall biosynthesis